MSIRAAVDIGGTFTDLVMQADDRPVQLVKAPTQPADPIGGIMDTVDLAAAELGLSAREFLGRIDLFMHGTTHAINAIIQGRTAPTALLITEGHPDVLVFREGGRRDPFDAKSPFPEPYVPRRFTYEVPERVLADGSVDRELDRAAVVRTLQELAEREEVESVAVCLLWSIVNPAHELAVGELIEEVLPDVTYSLSHRVNPSLREYRRASSTAIDASLKPLMNRYLGSLSSRLAEAGLAGEVLMVTSTGGVCSVADAAERPIESVNSGPSMAPIAGRFFASEAVGSSTAIVADTGGTTFDVSLVRDGRIPRTRETWIGAAYEGHMTGFPSVDVNSMGAGGGSIASLHGGRILRVGPESAGADPGPASYGRGGTEPTVTDAALVLGFLDPATFLGGRMELDRDAAAAAIETRLCAGLGMSSDEVAAGILLLASDQMAKAIEEITLNQGIDPANATLVGGGGAFGLNAVAIARRLGCRTVVIPHAAAGLSAAGALISDLTSTYARTFVTATDRFDRSGVNRVLDELRADCEQFSESTGLPVDQTDIEVSAEARYPSQVWELEVDLPVERFETEADTQSLGDAFHNVHQSVFAVHDPESAVEIVGWRATVRCRLPTDYRWISEVEAQPSPTQQRQVLFPSIGRASAAVMDFRAVEAEGTVSGPAIVEMPLSTVVVDPGAHARVGAAGSLILELDAGDGSDSAAMGEIRTGEASGGGH